MSNKNSRVSMKLKKISQSLLGASLVLSTGTSFSINTGAIMASSGSAECMDYKIVGTCFWLFCTQFGCKVRTSTKVKHFIPEVVVSSYNHEGQNPWEEMNIVSQGKGGGEYETPYKKYSQLSFKNVDVIGHPQGAISQMLESTGYFCQSQATSFMPYYLSSLDFFAWRRGLPEMFYPEARVFGMREIRANGDTWGNIYPRAGAITQKHDYKASAVTAHRVADVITRTGQPHLYIGLTKQDEQGKWYPEPVKEGEKNNHKWQQLHPTTSQSCSIFPDTPPTMLSENGSYAWALWRPYKCCKKRGQTFLYSVDWSN